MDLRTGRLPGARGIRAEGSAGAQESRREQEGKMEQPVNNCIPLERESTMNIRGIQYVVTAHYDDAQESLPEKLARLLKKDVCTLDKP